MRSSPIAGAPTAAAIGPEHLVRLIRTRAATSRGALARLTGLSRSTVSQRVDALLEAGYIRERPGRDSSGGRPPATLEFDGSNNLALCAAIERSMVVVGLVDFAGVVVERQAHPIAVEEGPDAVLGVVTSGLRSIMAEGAPDPGSIRGIGVAVPAPVEPSTGRPIEPTVMPGWHNCPIRERLEESFAFPIYVDNDANVMALAEYGLRESSVESLVYVRASDGIGAGLILGGRLFRGTVGAAGALGHTAVDSSSALCTCGNVGCVATIAGGAAVASRLRASGQDVATAADVVSLVRSGHQEALQGVRAAGRELGRVLAGVVNLLDPGMVTLGGEFADIQDFLAGVREEVYRRALPLAGGHLEIVRASLGEDATLKGAACLVADELLSPRPVLSTLPGS